MKNIVVVSYPMGRVGSSAVMGLLSLLDFKANGKSHLTGKSDINPKGFFELKENNNIIGSIYGDKVYPGMTEPPSIELLFSVAKENAELYSTFIEKEFVRVDNIAIKSPRCLTLPIFHYLRHLYSVKIIFLSRKHSEQVSSIGKVWENENRKTVYSLDEIGAWVKKWIRFSELVVDKVDIPCFYLNFNALIETPRSCTSQLAEFVNADALDYSLIYDWLDPSLVNRKHYAKEKKASIFSRLFHIFTNK